ncbi:folliculin-interacting protein middle domain-containing protein [Pilobolus umbonatus]|nr:folliculin-interacting protein middle domain-containing protein [Pilobolus umbonatus]
MPSLSLHDQYRQNARKLDLTGDMIFGTAPLAYKGMNTKVHYYKRDKDPQIVISKLFTLNNNHQYYANSTYNNNISEQSSDDDRYSASSIYPPVLGLKSKHRSSKRNRRFSQTYMENGIFSPTPLPPSRLFSADNPVRQASRSVKYAVAMIITLEDKNETLYDFIFSHFALIENRLHQLQSVAFKQLYQFLKNHPTPQLQHRKRSSMCYLSPNSFQHDPILIEAVSKFKRSFYDLYETPRIQEPLWLNMSTFPQNKSRYEKNMMHELIDLIQHYDNKTHNYFVSTLITAVLMHHLSWVHTVAPSDDDTHIGCHHGNYDPLWAQLSDLYGFIGTPSRITRTIVVGLRPNIVRRILYILTYFIRCNEVYENTESRSKDILTESIFYPELNDTNNDHKFEDKIVRHLTGDVESIAIPNTNNTTESPSSSLPRHHIHYPSSSIESTNSFKSKWYSDTEERPWSPDPFVSSPSLSLDIPIISPSGSYGVAMPKSTITHMEPDITQADDEERNSNQMRIDRLYAKSYGRSLMASYCDTYKSDFVLMGIPTLPSTSVLDADLKSTLDQFSLTDSVSEASCLVIDTNSL